MQKHVISTALAMFCSLALTAQAAAQAQTPGQTTTPPAGQTPTQTPAQPTTPKPTQTPATSATQSGTTTMVGCLYHERDVPGRTPNVAEKAGVLEDYILVNAMPASSAAGKPGASASVGTSGAAGKGNMYKVEQIPDEQLRAHVGKRVEVTGRVDAEPGDAKVSAGAAAGQRTDKSVGPDRIELPEFEATSIKEVAGSTCPAKPAAQ